MSLHRDHRGWHYTLPLAVLFLMVAYTYPKALAPPGQQARDAEGDPLPAFDRPALFGVHLLHGLQGQDSGEYKVMGLAPYGEPKFKDTILNNAIDLKEDGTFRLDQSYFDYCTGLRMTNDKFADLFGGPARKPDKELLTQKHMDLAASIQAVTEEIVLRPSR